jgi:hypothetical protein
MAFNDAGDIIVVGGDMFNNQQGQVRVYQYINNSWTQLGSDSDLQGSTTNIFYGHKVAINSDGTIIGVSAHSASSGKGEVYAYQYSNGSWSSMMGSASYIDVGNSTSSRLGHRLRMSGDGTILTAAAYGGSAYVKSYKWDGSSWSQRGSSFGFSGHGGNWGMDMSRDGNIVAVSNYDGGSRVYEFANNSWSLKDTLVTINRDVLMGVDKWGTRVAYGTVNSSSDQIRVSDIAYTSSQVETGEYETVTTDVIPNMIIDGNLTIEGNLIAPVSTPSSSSDTGTAGQVAVDENYIYICTATDTWKRIALSTW